MTSKQGPEWNFERHCTQEIPEIFSKEFFGYASDTGFAMTKSFQILTPKAVEILRDVVLTDENVQKYCRFSEQRKKISSHQHTAGTYAYRNVGGVNRFVRQMMTCKKFESYVQRITGEPVAFWPLMWESTHMNVQEGVERENVPNVAWHTDFAKYSMLINVSDMPENPEGGETVCEKLCGEKVTFKYSVPGDSTIIKGSEIRHCGIPGKNYKKIVLAAGLGTHDISQPISTKFSLKTYDYSLYHSDPVNMVTQYTKYRFARQREQILALGKKSADDQTKIREVMLLESRQLEDSYVRVMEFFQSGDFKRVPDGIWSE